MDFTGERFIPDEGLTGELIIEHCQRYHAVLGLIKDKVVLDVASGEGYGSELLAGQARQVFGLEIDRQAVAEARAKYPRPNLHFIQGTIAQIPLPDASCDVVVSFETIEHVAGDLQEAFIREIRRVLRPEGVCIISTPDRRIYSDLPGYHNEYHVKEFYRDEYYDFLHRHFQSVKFWEQCAVLAYVLTDNQGESLAQFMPAPRLEGKYIVALCSNAALPEVEMGLVTLDREDLYRKKVERVVELQGEIDEKNRHLFRLEDEVTHCNTIMHRMVKEHGDHATALQQAIVSLQADLKGQQERVSELQAALAGGEGRSRELQAALAESEARLTRIRATLGWQLVQKVYALKDRVLKR